MPHNFKAFTHGRWSTLSLKRKRISRYSFLFFLVVSGLMLGQWITNSKLHTQLVFDSVNPVNITSVEDGSGGAFIFWQDTKANAPSDISFLHFDNNGNVSFRADGKSVSSLTDEKKNPVAEGNHSQTAVVLWENISSGKSCLYGQVVRSNGVSAWNDEGMKINAGQLVLVNYNVSLDEKNTTYISYIEKNDAAPTEYFLRLQIVSESGTEKFLNNGLLIGKSTTTKNNSMVFPDAKGGCFILWGENKNKIFQIHAQYVDDKGKTTWKSPVDISGHEASITGFNACVIRPGLLYVYWQNLGKKKTISHQLLSAGGKTLLDERRMLVTAQKGNQMNPKAVAASDSSVILSWVHDSEGKKNIFFQKFKTNGAQLWGSSGVQASLSGGDKFGQMLISNDRGGAFAAWLEQKNQSEKPIISAQEISEKKERLWNDDGLTVAADTKTDKSYLSLFPDQRGGVVFLFKEIVNGKPGIYGQRLFGTEWLVSQVTDFSAKVVADSVQLSWSVVNESDLFDYKIEKMNRADAVDNVWRQVSSSYTQNVRKTNKYQVSVPLEDVGVVYFRLSQFARDGRKNFSAVEKVTFAPANTNETYVVQNAPNPFTGKTTIVYNLAEDENVKIEIFNSRIEKVSDVVITDAKVGKNKFAFDGSGLPAGIYFYRFTVGDFVDVKKMVITK